MTKKVLITGIHGQDGSYLADLLLKKGYDVYGMERRSAETSRVNTKHLIGKITFVKGDLTDQGSVSRIVDNIRPDEIYNLAAQSFVGESWNTPEHTSNVTGLGALRMLEAIRVIDKNIRFYQASSSEMIGRQSVRVANEETPFYPRSPYGVAKLYAHWMTKNYRESYGMFCCSGILYNHECITSNTPIIIKKDGYIDIVTCDELVPVKGHSGKSKRHYIIDGIDIYDGIKFVPLKSVTATRLKSEENRSEDHKFLSVETRGGVVDSTAHHTFIYENKSENRADRLKVGEKLLMADKYPISDVTSINGDFAELLGCLVADGSIQDGRGKFAKNDDKIRNRVSELWYNCFLLKTGEGLGVSGFSNNVVKYIRLNGSSMLLGWLQSLIYTKKKFKKVPSIILNSPIEIQKRFIDGYYMCDGLKKGKGLSFTTNSSVLAQGLCMIYHNCGFTFSIYIENRNNRYYHINVSNYIGGKGEHFKKDKSEIKCINNIRSDSGDWVFDLETGSGVFMAGVGLVVVHNSPRRQIDFVTRKITDGVARIRLGLADYITLGNIDARRDWGYAPDFVRAMHLMLQQDKPDDYIIATNTDYSVKDFLVMAFKCIGITDWGRYVKIDEKYKRPAEVDYLRGDYSKAKMELGWEPEVPIEDWVHMMVMNDISLLSSL